MTDLAAAWWEKGCWLPLLAEAGVKNSSLHVELSDYFFLFLLFLFRFAILIEHAAIARPVSPCVAPSFDLSDRMQFLALSCWQSDIATIT